MIGLRTKETVECRHGFSVIQKLLVFEGIQGVDAEHSSVFQEVAAGLLKGDRIERLVGVTDTKSPESLHHLNQVMRSMGIIDELTRQKIKAGEEVQIGAFSFTYGENLF